MSKSIVWAADFGAESVVVMAGESKKAGELRLVGSGKVRVEGIQYGEIIHVGDVTESFVGALREAEEEIALPPHLAQIVGVTDRYHTFTGFDIVPVVAVIPPDLPLRAQESEVADWFELPLAYALDPANRVRQGMEFEGEMRHFYEILWQDRRIWGITAAILANLSRRLGHDHFVA